MHNGIIILGFESLLTFQRGVSVDEKTRRAVSNDGSYIRCQLKEVHLPLLCTRLTISLVTPVHVRVQGSIPCMVCSIEIRATSNEGPRIVCQRM